MSQRPVERGWQSPCSCGTMDIASAGKQVRKSTGLSKHNPPGSPSHLAQSSTLSTPADPADPAARPLPFCGLAATAWFSLSLYMLDVERCVDRSTREVPSRNLVRKSTFAFEKSWGGVGGLRQRECEMRQEADVRRL